MKTAVLASGSTGNCVVVWEEVPGDEKASPFAMLIDIGTSCKATEEGLRDCHLKPSDVAAILITHAHGDHINGLTTWGRKYPQALLYAHPATLTAINSKGNPGLVQVPIEFGKGFVVGELKPGQGFACKPVAVKHDTEGACCYMIYNSQRRKLAMWGESGVITPEMWEQGVGAHVYMIEANHDKLACLTNENRPEATNERTYNTHMSNTQAAEAIRYLPEPVHTVFLVHISEGNNSIEHKVRPIMATANHLREEDGRKKVNLVIASPKFTTQTVEV